MKKRFYEIDTLYTIGTLLVLFGHSHSSDWTRFSTTPLNPTILFIYTFHMPLFFLIAGFLFMNSHRLERDGYGKYISDKALKLLTPYAVVSLIAAVPKYYLEHHSFSGVMLGIGKGLIAPRHGVWGHFWFLPVFFLVYAIFGIFKAFFRRDSVKRNTVIAVVITGVIYFIPSGTEWFGINDLKDSLLFFALGMLIYVYGLNKFELATKTQIMVMIICTALAVTLFHFCHGVRPLMLLTGILMLCECWLLAKVLGENKATAWISNNNFTVYIYSWPFQSIAMLVCDKMNIHWYITLIVMFTVGLSAPIAVITIYKRLHFFNNRFFDLVLGVK